MPKARAQRTLAALFFFSGALALVYEALWFRRFALVFGSAAPATAAVLAAYFAGLAAGSWVFGSAANRFTNPLRVYALLEAGIGLGALLAEILLRALEDMPSSVPFGLPEKTGLAFVALGVPTVCMGATLPVLGALLDQHQRHLGSTAGLLYVMNTAGAALGVMAAPFVLLPKFGSTGSLVGCCAGNLLLAAIAWKLAKPVPIRPAPPGKIRSIREMAPAFLSGFAAFIVQILWNRAFAQVHENSLYSFSVIAAVFILALAAGGQISRILIAWNFRTEAIIGSAWLLAAAILCLSPRFFFTRTQGLAYLVTPDGWFNYGKELLALGFLFVFPAAFLLGLVLPAIMEAAGRASAETGRILGVILSVNLAGSVAGAIVGGFVLPGIIGLWESFSAVALLVAAAGVWTLCSANAGARSARIIAGACVAGLLLLSRSTFPRLHLDPNERLISIAEGSHGITGVTEVGSSRRLKLNNYYVLGGTEAAGDERMQAHLPILMARSPKRIAFLGVGTAITASGALFHESAREIALIELVPEVMEAARIHFSETNLRVVENPRVRVVIDDARNYLRRTRSVHDVIIGDLVVPWRAGEGALFTIENFRAARGALAPGGIYCQWVPLFQLSREEFDSIARTFLEVFPVAQFWRGDFSPTSPAVALIGFLDEAAFDPAAIARNLAAMRPDPANPHLTEEFAVWMNFLGVARAPDFHAPINSEDKPWVELTGPLRHAGSGRENLFVGRKFHAWTTGLQTRTAEGAADPGPEGWRSAHAGSLLYEFTLHVSENDRVAATRAHAALRATVPGSVYRNLFPE